MSPLQTHGRPLAAGHALNGLRDPGAGCILCRERIDRHQPAVSRPRPIVLST